MFPSVCASNRENQPLPLFKLADRVVDPEARHSANQPSGLRRIAAGLVAALVALAGSSHAADGAPKTANDRFERFNRKAFSIQIALMRHGLVPIGAIYRFLTPGPIGKAIHNILVNLSEPVVIVNDVLQVRPARAGAAAVRFVVDSTAGLAGMIDVVGATGLPHRPSSFGDTLGRYGVKPGPYLFIPVIGPSTVRDLFGNVVDAVIDPVHFSVYPYRQQVSIGVALVGGLDQLTRSEGDLRTLLSGAADPYATLRSTYLQNREAEVNGVGAAPIVLPNLDDPEPGASQPNTSPSATSDAPAGRPGLAERFAGDQLATLDGLPDGKDGQADDKLTGALDQGQGQGQFGRETEQGAQEGVAGLLNTDAHGSHEGGAPDGHYQGFEAQDRQRADPDAGNP